LLLLLALLLAASVGANASTPLHEMVAVQAQEVAGVHVGCWAETETSEIVVSNHGLAADLDCLSS